MKQLSLTGIIARETIENPSSLKPLRDNGINKDNFFLVFATKFDAVNEIVIEKALNTCDAAGMRIVQPEPTLNLSLYEIFESKFLGGITKKVRKAATFNQFGDREIIEEIEI